MTCERFCLPQCHQNSIFFPKILKYPHLRTKTVHRTRYLTLNVWDCLFETPKKSSSWHASGLLQVGMYEIWASRSSSIWKQPQSFPQVQYKQEEHLVTVSRTSCFPGNNICRQNAMHLHVYKQGSKPLISKAYKLWRPNGAEAQLRQNSPAESCCCAFVHDYWAGHLYIHTYQYFWYLSQLFWPFFTFKSCLMLFVMQPTQDLLRGIISGGWSLMR